MRRLAETRRVVETWRGMEKKINDIYELVSLESGEVDELLIAEITSEIEELTGRLSSIELEIAFSGEYDRRNDIMAIYAGRNGMATNLRFWILLLVRKQG